ncbi:unnamed protein product [Polarella glacialis]|uniref:PARP catalytic domain-containing protein n=1 Tax=Polarella glacialis TaxID=89957 RepID=A0A813KUA6_POLGL|nr:unnamed protein product [Polarella glacialis]CAE8712924.1 unnamed protein product [Polarella glacialis]
MAVYKRYHQERCRIKGEIDTRDIAVNDPNLRASLCSASATLPGELLAAVNEVRVLHGTKAAHVFPILADGFNERLSGGPRSYFGQTLYFAEDAGKCDQYCTRDSSYMEAHAKTLHEMLYKDGCEHPGDVFYMFACLHTMGKFVRTDSKLLDAPNLDHPDCCVWATPQRREFACIPGLKPSLHYHSLVAEVGKDITRYREIVQSRAERVYPEYLIAYKRAA